MKALSLFSCTGIGELLLYKNGIEIIASNELEEKRCKFYKHVHPDTKMFVGDINDQYKSIVEFSKNNRVELIIATPPCQSFSKAGKMKTDDPRSCLYKHAIHAIKDISPKYAIMENVPEFAKPEIIEDIYDTLEGYRIYHKIVNVADYGIPQIRKRCIFLFTRKGIKPILKFPKHTTPHITVRDAIGDLPSLESSDVSDIHRFHYSKTHNQNHIKWMRHTPTGQTAHDNEKWYPQKDGRHIKGYRTTYKRISWDKPAPTITMANGSISSQNNVHPGRPISKGRYSDARVLTIYELMKLSGIPDEWDPPTWASDSFIRKMIGEAVPPPLFYNLTYKLRSKSSEEL